MIATASALSVLAMVYGCGGDEDCKTNRTCDGAAAHAGSAGNSGGGSGTDAGGSSGGTVNGGGSSSMSGSSGTSGTMGNGGEGGGGSHACMGGVADDAACWTSNEFGVFVSSDTGDDATGDGSKEAPFKSITKGATAAAAAGKNVYVCLGSVNLTYPEKLSFTDKTDGLRIYGGFDCENWDYSTARSALVESPENIALRIASLKKGVHIENLRFKAKDATGTGPDASSYGAFVTDSVGVELTRVELTAGKGAKGADGDPGGVTSDAAPPTATQDGKPADCSGTPADADGGKWETAVCGSRGGQGGLAVVDTDGAPGLSGTPTANVDPVNAVNRGLGATVAGEDGQPGTKGSKGIPGMLGSRALERGELAAAGYSPASGHTGGEGFPGQGGGGGGASKGSPTCRGASGGAGGLGGCGGKAGLLGEGGGASVGLFAWTSQIVLVACTVESLPGGAGGAGGAGGGGGGGGAGGAAGQGNQVKAIGLSGQGGQGGPGGNGGSGSGGTGGPSYALVYSGTKPTYTQPDTNLKSAEGGAAGVGGQVLTAKAPDGTKGESGPELEVK